jgi:hypothetical protein
MDHRYKPSDFEPSERLFRGFQLSNIVAETGEIDTDSIKFPDFSCNWERFSKPEDVKRRAGGRETDGCYAFTVEVARYLNMATVCHDPMPDNYAHVEVRSLRPGESVDYEPPKKRKFRPESKKFEYRQNIIYNLQRLIEPTA